MPPFCYGRIEFQLLCRQSKHGKLDYFSVLTFLRKIGLLRSVQIRWNHSHQIHHPKKFCLAEIYVPPIAISTETNRNLYQHTSIQPRPHPRKRNLWHSFSEPWKMTVIKILSVLPMPIHYSHSGISLFLLLHEIVIKATKGTEWRNFT